MLPRTALGCLRLGFVGVWLAPRFTAEAFGLKPDEHPGMTTLSRLIGGRTVALGAATVAAQLALGLRSRRLQPTLP